MAPGPTSITVTSCFAVLSLFGGPALWDLAVDKKIPSDESSPAAAMPLGQQNAELQDEVLAGIPSIDGALVLPAPDVHKYSQPVPLDIAVKSAPQSSEDIPGRSQTTPHPEADLDGASGIVAKVLEIAPQSWTLPAVVVSLLIDLFVLQLCIQRCRRRGKADECEHGKCPKNEIQLGAAQGKSEADVMVHHDAPSEKLKAPGNSEAHCKTSSAEDMLPETTTSEEPFTNVVVDAEPPEHVKSFSVDDTKPEEPCTETRADCRPSGGVQDSPALLSAHEKLTAGDEPHPEVLPAESQLPGRVTASASPEERQAPEPNSPKRHTAEKTSSQATTRATTPEKSVSNTDRAVPEMSSPQVSSSPVASSPAASSSCGSAGSTPAADYEARRAALAKKAAGLAKKAVATPKRNMAWLSQEFGSA